MSLMDVIFTSFLSQFLVLAFIILFAFLSFRRPRFAALLFPIFLPFYLIKLRLDYSILPPTNLLEVLLIIFLAINWRFIRQGLNFLVSHVSCFLPTGQAGKFHFSRYLLASIALLLAATILSTAFAINQRTPLGAVKSWFILPIFLFFALLPLLRSPSFRLKFHCSLVLSGAAAALMSLPFVTEGLYAYDGRLAGIYLSPNHLAMALVPGIIALILFLLSSPPRVKARDKLRRPACLRFAVGFGKASRRGRGSRIILYIILFLEILILYLTYSYAAWISLGVALLLLLVTSYELLVTKKSLPYYLITALIIVLLGVSQLSNPKLQHIVSGDYYNSLHSRLMIWQSAWKISQDYWLTGVGAGNFQEAYLDYQKYFNEPYIEWAVPMPHNIFLAFQTQLGILGLLSFVSIVILTFSVVIPAPYETTGQATGIQENQLDPRASLRSPEDDKKGDRELKIGYLD
ncbi:MAG: O-antigen ligase family protein, partial [Candidatus Moranbacteria bacterium]|nr:O-antigen ligase family protein [Candidatus Moranbacteria bacterium]